MLNIRVIKSFFYISNLKKIQFFKTSFNNKNSISFSHIKFILTLIFAPKMMEFWSFFQFCFWGPLKLLRPLKKAQTLDSWSLTMPLKTRPWIRLVLKKCPVSTVQSGSSWIFFEMLFLQFDWVNKYPFKSRSIPLKGHGSTKF